MTAHHDLKSYYESHLVPLEAGPASCVDERGLIGGEIRRRSYQLCGGSNEIHDLLLIACHQVGLDVNALPASNGQPVNLLSLAHQVFTSSSALKYGLELGVHNDDEHGHITDPKELARRAQGCGHDRVRGTVLQKGWGITLTTQPENIVPLELNNNVHNETYTGHHFAHALPVENFRVSTTLDTQTVLEEDKPAFNHDVWVVSELTEAMAQIVSLLGGEYAKVAHYLRQYSLADSQKVYRLTLAELGNPNGGVVIEVGK